MSEEKIGDNVGNVDFNRYSTSDDCLDGGSGDSTNSSGNQLKERCKDKLKSICAKLNERAKNNISYKYEDDGNFSMIMPYKSIVIMVGGMTDYFVWINRPCHNIARPTALDTFGHIFCGSYKEFLALDDDAVVMALSTSVSRAIEKIQQYVNKIIDSYALKGNE